MNCATLKFPTVTEPDQLNVVAPVAVDCARVAVIGSYKTMSVEAPFHEALVTTFSVTDMSVIVVEFVFTPRMLTDINLIEPDWLKT